MFRLLGDSHIGRAWRALSTRQDISSSLGIDVHHYKLLALVIAAVMATLAGAFYVAFTRFVGPDLYDIAQVINLMFMLFVGGLRSTVGPIVGAAFVILVPQAVGGFEHYQNLVFFGLLSAGDPGCVLPAHSAACAASARWKACCPAGWCAAADAGIRQHHQDFRRPDRDISAGRR